MDDYDIWNNLTYLNPIFFILGIGVIMLIGKFFK